MAIEALVPALPHVRRQAFLPCLRRALALTLGDEPLYYTGIDLRVGAAKTNRRTMAWKQTLILLIGPVPKEHDMRFVENQSADAP